MEKVNIIFHVATGAQYKWDFGKYDVEGKIITAAQDAIRSDDTPLLIMEHFDNMETLLDCLMQFKKGVNTYGIISVYLPEATETNPDNPILREKLREYGSKTNYFEMLEKTYSVQLMRFRTLSDDAFDPPIPHENRADAEYYANLKKDNSTGNDTDDIPDNEVTK